MKFIENIELGLRVVLLFLKERFSVSNLIMVLLLMVTISITFRLLIQEINYRLNRQKLKVIRNNSSFLKKMVTMLSEYNYTKYMLEIISYKVAIYNKDSIEKNKEYSVIFLILIIVFILLLGLVIIPSDILVWYMSLFYLIILLIFISLGIYAINMAARSSFSKKLPKTYRVINSRLIITENILQAIELSKNDFDKSIAREMARVYDCLKKNTKSRAEETFEFLEKMYKNEYFTILLSLIYQAHYKGISHELKKQFEDTKEDILTQLEDQRDLDFIAKLYLGLGIFFPFSIKFVESFNEMGLGEKASLFYSTPRGMVFKLVILTCILIYSAIMLILAKNI